MGNPPDKWQKVSLPTSPSSDVILSHLNTYQPTAAFVQECVDGLFLFLGNYSQGN